MTDYPGKCHCGAISFVYSTRLTPSDWSIRACQCSFCRAHDALSTSDPDGFIRLSTNDAGKLQRYRFGLRTADFLLCRECGVYIGAIMKTGNGHRGIVNTHALIATPADIAGVAPIHYDGEDSGKRVARREDRWTPADQP